LIRSVSQPATLPENLPDVGITTEIYRKLKIKKRLEK
jgi:hypothetical protein